VENKGFFDIDSRNRNYYWQERDLLKQDEYNLNSIDIPSQYNLKNHLNATIKIFQPIELLKTP
jgi:fructose-1,6-bisphosphatase